MEKEVELAKSWFVLSQIFMILSGFLFAAGGVTWNSSTEIDNSQYDLLSNLLSQYYDGVPVPRDAFNLTLDLLSMRNEESLNQMKLSNQYNTFGIIMAVLSVMVWSIGYREMQKATI